ncbi:3-oxoadipate enol-lactonase [Rhizobium helianthi]|uniref:3-oxoadipate enol-lactonase n=1 Tax=Rhizobium helianthi TaxID=1132695 RepID=A0ABW4M3I0_9HYPH
MQFVRIGDTVISHRVHGLDSKKPAILFINSLGTDLRIWDKVVADLSSDFTLILFDKRGHGLSDLGQPPYRIEDFADDAIGLLEHYGISQVVLCGLSIGGLISLSIFDKRPDLVRGIFFADTAHKIGTPDFWETRIRAVLDNGIGSILDPIMSRWFTAPYRRPENADYRGYCTMLERQSAEGYAGTCAAIRDADFTETARRINVATLCVVGEEDGSTPPELVRSLANLIRGSQFEIIPGAAHLPCIEAPSVFLRLLRRFLSTLPGVLNG